MSHPILCWQALKHLNTAISYSSLWTVDLSFNRVGVDGAFLLAKGLPSATMTALNLSNCFLTQRGTDVGWGKEEGVATHTNMRVVCCTGADLSGAAAIMAALEHNQSIAALDMSNNMLVKTSFRSFDDRSDDYTVMLAFAKSLAVNRVLLRVDLSSNAVKKRGQVAVLEALRSSPCGLRFAPHVKVAVETWFQTLMKRRRAGKKRTDVSRYPPASTKWALARLLQTVFQCLREERQIMF